MKKGLMVLLSFVFVIMIGVALSVFAHENDKEQEKIIREDQKIEKGKDNPLLVLVNKNYPVPEDWKGERVELINGQSIDSRAYEDLQKMMDDAREEGLEPLICSSWRSRETQGKLFEEEIASYRKKGYSKAESEKMASEWVAVPGTSEHELGLALDIVSEGNQILDEEQKNTPEQMWFMEHCYEYGFILRYPEDKKDITGIGHEPWHYRYVGREAALEIKEMNVCLEEYVLGTGSLTR